MAGEAREPEGPPDEGRDPERVGSERAGSERVGSERAGLAPDPGPLDPGLRRPVPRRSEITRRVGALPLGETLADSGDVPSSPTPVAPATCPSDPDGASRPARPSSRPGLVSTLPPPTIPPPSTIPPRSMPPASLPFAPTPEAASEPPFLSVHQAGAAERLGRCLGGAYRLLRVLGGGAGGAVYEAIHETTGKAVALKVFHPGRFGGAEHERRFVRETRLAARLSHRHVVRLLDAGREPDGTLWQALELLRGRDLSRLLDERDRLTVHEAVSIGRQLLAALEAVHALGFVHRDVKPENVFLADAEDEGGANAGANDEHVSGVGGPDAGGATSDSELPARRPFVKLLDFGIARSATPDSESAITLEGVILGTPSYMAPEQISADHRIGPATDIWAAGAVMFTMLAGRPPFDEVDLTRLLTRIAREPAPSLAYARPDAPLSLVRAVARALRTHPAHRFESAAEMAAALTGPGTPVGGLDW